MPHLLDSGPASLLIVDDDITVVQVLAKALAGIGSIRYALSGADALRLLEQEPPDVVLLDAHMPGMSGFDVLGAMRAHPQWEDIPAIFITSDTSQGMEEEGLAQGAADFIGKPFHPAIVAARVRTQLRLKRALDRLRQLSSIDALTGIANRRTLDETLLRECKRSQRSRTAIAVLMLDVDHFKAYNDHHGHPAGDACLQIVAAAVAENVRAPIDFVARYGGEEFVAVLPGATHEVALQVAERVRQGVMDKALPHSASPTARVVTVSVGVATSASPGTDCPDADRLVGRADRALYEAKRGTRNRVQAFRDETPGTQEPS